MTQLWKLELQCDAPGCTAAVQTPELEARARTLPGEWDIREVDGEDVVGCCARHLAAAVLHKLGFEAEAVDLTGLVTAVKAPDPGGGA